MTSMTKASGAVLCGPTRRSTSRSISRMKPKVRWSPAPQNSKRESQRWSCSTSTCHAGPPMGFSYAHGVRDWPVVTRIEPITAPQHKSYLPYALSAATSTSMGTSVSMDSRSVAIETSSDHRDTVDAAPSYPATVWSRGLATKYGLSTGARCRFLAGGKATPAPISLVRLPVRPRRKVVGSTYNKATVLVGAIPWPRPRPLGGVTSVDSVTSFANITQGFVARRTIENRRLPVTPCGTKPRRCGGRQPTTAFKAGLLQMNQDTEKKSD